MKTRTYSQEQPIALSFTPFAMQQQQATSGTVTANLSESSDDEFAKQAVGAEVPRATLGSTVASLIEAARATGPKRIVIAGVGNNVRVLKAYPVATDVFDTAEKVIVLTRVIDAGETEPSKVAPWVAAQGTQFSPANQDHTDMMAAIQDVLSPKPPRFSLAALLGRLEDLRNVAEGRMIGNIVVDQEGDGTVVVTENQPDIAAPEAVLIQDITPAGVGDVEALPFE